MISGVDAATGEVAEVSAIADASSGVASFPVTVTFTDDSGTYHAGANAAVQITYAQRTDAVLIPSFAVTTEGTESIVTVDVDGTREERVVTTGLTSGAMVEITSGLDAGESVVISIQGRFGGGQGGFDGGQGGPGQVPTDGSDGDQ